MMYLNSNEEAIIGTFIDKESDYVGKSIKLSWNADNVTAIYDSFIEDENGLPLDDDEYEEYWSLIFKLIDVTGSPPVDVTEDGFFTINYHNFPQSYIVL